MTGRHPNRFGCFKWGYTLRSQEVTVAEALKRAGYATGHFGKWHLGPVRKRNAVSPGGSGFDHWISSPNFYENNPLMSNEGKVVQLRGESSMATVEAALPFIKQAAGEESPFLAVIWFGNPHTPHVPVPELAALYADQPKAIQNYLAEVTGIDRAMGRLREELGKLGIRENTLLWYTSDNGSRPPGSTGGFRGMKGQVYEGGLRVPAVMEWPARIRSPRATDIPCNSVDIYPTLVELARVEIPEQPRPLDGISLVPLIDGKMTTREKPMGFWDYPIPGRSTPSAEFLRRMKAAEQGDRVAPPNAEWENKQYTEKHDPDDRAGHAAWLDGHWKLHRISPRSQGKAVRYELYDLAADPKEEHDLAEQEPRRVERMKTDLEAWQQSVIHSLNGEDYAG
jgi:arylsulfatase A-like enzyme